MYIHTYIYTYVHIYIRTYIHTYITCAYIQYRLVQKFDGENFDELIMGFIGETLRGEGLQGKL